MFLDSDEVIVTKGFTHAATNPEMNFRDCEFKFMDETARTSLKDRDRRSLILRSVCVENARRLKFVFAFLILLLFSTSAIAEWRPIESGLDRPELLFMESVDSESRVRPLGDLVDQSVDSTSEVDRVIPSSATMNYAPLQCDQCPPCELPPSLCSNFCEHEQRSRSEFYRGLSHGEFVKNDFVALFQNLDDDFKNFWHLENTVFLGTGLGIALGLRGSADDEVRDYTLEHPRRWGSFSEALGIIGNTETHVLGMTMLYATAYHKQDEYLMDFSRTLIRAYTLNGLSTLAIKAISNTDRPSDDWNNGKFGFPSAHVSSAFVIAATIEEYYGPRVGIPAYITASLIGWSRIDERDHDLSDVVFGAFLGYAIAKSVAGKELRNDSRIRFFPWTDPVHNTYGTMFEVDF